MKSKAYVAIHHSKALPLSIVRGPFSLSFIKGIRRNLRLKNPSVIRTLAFESAGFFQRIEFIVQRTWKDKYFQKKSLSVG